MFGDKYRNQDTERQTAIEEEGEGEREIKSD